VTILELANIIADLLGFDLKPIFMPARPLEVKAAFCSSDKARALLGYHTTYSLRAGLTEMIAWIRAKGPLSFRYSYEIEIKNSRTPRAWTEALM
jgi:UDP-glucose 4-epimerase